MSTRKLVVTALVAASISVFSASAALADNAGTVKVEFGSEAAANPDNDPQGCGPVSIYGWDMAYATGTYSVVPWAPGGVESQAGGYRVVPHKDRQLIAGPMTFSTGHYRLTVHQSGANPQSDKHKMFWIRCGSDVEAGGGHQPSPSTSPSPSGSPLPSEAPSASPSASPTESTSPVTSEMPGANRPGSGGAEAAGLANTGNTSGGAGAVAAENGLGAALAQTGTPYALGGLGLVLLLGGAAFFFLRRGRLA